MITMFMMFSLGLISGCYNAVIYLYSSYNSLLEQYFAGSFLFDHEILFDLICQLSLHCLTSSLHSAVLWNTRTTMQNAPSARDDAKPEET